jgi:hypothetical protein
MDWATTWFVVYIFRLLLAGMLVYFFYSRNPEAFQTQADSVLRTFVQIQHTINPRRIYDTNILQERVSTEDIAEYNRTRRWSWSPRTKELYKKAFRRNPYVRAAEDNAVDYAQTIYPESAILEILFQQSPEGQFALYGMRSPDGTQIVRCRPDAPGVELREYVGRDPVFYTPQFTTRNISDAEAAQLVPGLKPEVCNGRRTF